MKCGDNGGIEYLGKIIMWKRVLHVVIIILITYFERTIFIFSEVCKTVFGLVISFQY